MGLRDRLKDREKVGIRTSLQVVLPVATKQEVNKSIKCVKK